MARLMKHLSFPMKNINQVNKSLLEAARTIPADPTDYFRGQKRSTLTLPDNLLLFSRHDWQYLLTDGLRPDVHHRWVLLLALEGDADFMVDRCPLTVNAPCALLIPPLFFHHCHQPRGTRHAWVYITFEWPGHPPSAGQRFQVTPLPSRDQTLVLSIMKKWQEMPPGADATILSAELLTLLIRLFPEQTNETGPVPPKDSSARLLARLRTYLSTNLNRQPSISTLARELGISESHLRAEFRQATAQSLGRYLREWRIRQAAVLLRQNHLSVKETAEQMGYRDIYTFSRSFRNIMGFPPSTLKINPPESK
jgi:AraC-like DNA-binding protein